MYSSTSNNMKVLLLLAGLMALACADQVRFRSVEEGEAHLPDYLHVEIEHTGRRSLNIPSSLRLTRNTRVEDIKFYVDGEDSPADFTNVRFYQDTDNAAVVTARLEKTPQGLVRTLQGSFLKDGKSFDIDPETLPDDNENKRDTDGVDAHMHTIRASDDTPHHIPFEYPDGHPEENHNRSRRATTHYDVEMYWVSDPALYKLWTKQHNTGTRGMKQFFAHQANGVDISYGYVKNSNKGISISTWLTKMDILTSGRFNPTDGAKNGGSNGGRDSLNEDKVLELMAEYKNTKGWTWDKPDHFMMYTGYDLNQGVVGYAPVGGVCLPDKGISAVEYTGWHTWATAAHELGHNLGMRHDGKNGCSGSSGNVMSPSVVSLSDISNVRNAVKFSSCSVSDSKKCLDGKDGHKYPRKCLLDKVCRDGLSVDTSKLPGEFITLGEQCKDMHGDSVSGQCSSNFGADICKKLWCAKGGRCTTNNNGAANGSPCGSGKWCIEGACVRTSTRPTHLPKPCATGTTTSIPSSCKDKANDCRTGYVWKYPGLNCENFKSQCCRTCAEFGFQ